VGGLVTTEEGEDVEEAEATLILEHLNARISGPDNAGRLAFINRHLKLTNWQMTNLDAQFSESRAFQVEEFARMLGLMPIHLAQTEKQTSWGTGIAEQNVGLSRFNLMHHTSNFESTVRKILPDGQFVEFDYKGLLQGTPAQEIELLLAESGGGPIITTDEARAVLNLGPMPKTAAPAVAPQEDTNV
jgi:HK97 family phage portal protein